MNYVAENENEKTKETKKTAEADSYEDYENEAMEGNEESFGAEEVSLSDSDVSPYICPPPRSPSVPQAEVDLGQKDSFEERQKQLLKERWLTVTGRKPRNIPNVKRTYTEDFAKFTYFGDRRPAEVEKKMRENWLLAARKIKLMIPNFGKLQKELRLPALCDGLLSTRFGPDAETLTTSYRNGGVQVRNGSTGEVIRTLSSLEQKMKWAIRAVRYHPQNREILYIGGGTGKIQVFDINSSESIKTTGFVVTQINNLDISSDSNHLVIGGRLGIVCIYDPETLEKLPLQQVAKGRPLLLPKHVPTLFLNECLQLISVKKYPQEDETTLAKAEDEYHKLKVYGLRCHPTYPNIFVTGSWDCTVKVWDVRVQGAIKSIRGPMVYGDGVDVMGNTIVTASWRAENSLSLWDLSSGHLIKNIPIETKSTVYEGEFLYSVRFFSETPAGGLVDSSFVAVGGSGFSSLLVINTANGKAVASFPSYKAILALDVAGNVVAYGGKESLFRIGEVVITEQKLKKGK